MKNSKTTRPRSPGNGNGKGDVDEDEVLTGPEAPVPTALVVAGWMNWAEWVGGCGA